MLYELIDATDHADADDEVRSVIITGAGRGSCAGADLSSGANSSTCPAGIRTKTRTIGGTVADVSRFVFTSARNLSSVPLTVPAWVSVPR